MCRWEQLGAPGSWIHGKFARSEDVPAFHIENRAVANQYFADNMRSFDRASLNDPDANTVLQLLWRLQCLLARPGEEMTGERPRFTPRPGDDAPTPTLPVV